MRHRLYLALLLALLSPGLSLAQSPRQTAQSLVQEGNRLLDQGTCDQALRRFQRALDTFTEAYRVHVNIGSAYECLGDLPSAVTHFEGFLRRADRQGDAAMIAALQPRVEAARRQVGGVKLSCAVAGASVLIDERMVGKTPLADVIYLSPGPHLLRVQLAGRPPFEQRLRVEAGRVHELRVPWLPTPKAASVSSSAPLAPPALPPPPPPKPRRSRPLYARWWFWTAIGVAVAGGVLGGVLGARAGGDRLSGELGSIDMSRP